MFNKKIRERPPGNRLGFVVSPENFRQANWKAFENSWYGRMADDTLFRELGLAPENFDDVLAKREQGWEFWEGDCDRCGGHNGDDCHFFGNLVIQKRLEQLEKGWKLPRIWCMDCVLKRTRRQKLAKKQGIAGLLKPCSRCKEIKQVSEFGFDERYRLGRRSRCKKCEVELWQERQKKVPSCKPIHEDTRGGASDTRGYTRDYTSDTRADTRGNVD